MADVSAENPGIQRLTGVVPNRFSCAAFKSVPADQSAPQGQECLVKVHQLFVAHAQSPELIQPGKGSFYHPAPSPQYATMFCVAPHEKRDDASFTKTSADRFGIVTTVTQDAVGTMTRSGRWRGRPRCPCNAGIASPSERACCESFRVAPVSCIARERPGYRRSDADCSLAWPDQ